MNSFFNKLIYGGGIVFDLAKWLIVILIIFILFNSYFYAIFIVSGESMDPSLRDGEGVFWNKNIYEHKNPKRDDVVVINYPGDPNHKKYVKRIIGLPGEMVQIKDGEVYINEVPASESYLQPDLSSEPDGTWILKNGQYFVMGDNRPNSNDSRYFGAVDRRFILGKAISVVFPRFRLVKDI